MSETPIAANLKGKPSSMDAEPVELRIAGEKSARIDRLSDLASDWCSPILVKETRQALKSRQFFWTFFLLLAAVALWTMIGLTISDTSVAYGNAGVSLLTGYWMILGFPLAIVIPFGAYRSLAREYDDGTIQLISVTTMNARQIITGKLGSSVLQMLVYLSVLAPCIAFTYLLKGISLPQIAIGMAFCISGCLTLCCLALFFAGATRSKIYGVGVSILLIAIQFFALWIWCVGAYAIAWGEVAFWFHSEGTVMVYGLLALILSTGLLLFAAATLLISFDSDNRSTLVRVMMLVQQTLYFSFFAAITCYFFQPEAAVYISWISAHYWLLMGLIMIGEDTKLSRRISRSIPQSVAGRSMFSLLLPGSGRGLIFATVNIWLCALFALAVVVAAPHWFPRPETSLSFGGNRTGVTSTEIKMLIPTLLSVCLYPSFFLAATWWICLGLRRRWSRQINSLSSTALGAVLILIVTGAALMFHFNALPSHNWRYWSPEQIFNWYWTTVEIAEGNGSMGKVDPVIAFLAAIMMAGFVVITMFAASRELLQSRASTPQRVRDERQRQKQPATPPPGESIDEIFSVDRSKLD